MPTKSINFRVDQALKEEADTILSEIGLNMTAAITLFLKQVVNNRAIPFKLVTADPFFSSDNQTVLEQRLKDYQGGKFSEHELIEVD